MGCKQAHSLKQFQVLLKFWLSPRHPGKKTLFCGKIALGQLRSSRRGFDPRAATTGEGATADAGYNWQL
jgi:hypothetical protein